MIKFKLPFETSILSIVSSIPSCNKKGCYLCADCRRNKVGEFGEDLGCSINERIPGDTVTSCGSFVYQKRA